MPYQLAVTIEPGTWNLELNRLAESVLELRRDVVEVDRML
jgi:hypothetical protein